MALHMFIVIDINWKYIAAIPQFGIIYLWDIEKNYITNISSKKRLRLHTHGKTANVFPYKY